MFDLTSVMTLFSLFLTPIAISQALYVVVIFHPSFQKAINLEVRESFNNMIIGVYFGQLGGAFDNAWWFVAWSFYVFDPTSSGKEFFFNEGVYSNVFARQGLGILGAFYHIKAGNLMEIQTSKYLMYISAFLGVMWVSFLVAISS